MEKYICMCIYIYVHMYMNMFMWIDEDNLHLLSNFSLTNNKFLITKSYEHKYTQTP